MTAVGTEARPGAARDADGARAFRSHYAASQFRTETWNALNEAAQTLRRRSERGREADDVREEAARVLDVLRRIEVYTCFPGVKICDELCALLDAGRHADLAARTSQVVRLLVSGLYRRRRVAGPDDEAHAEDADGAERAAAEARPYFEVLVVDDCDPDDFREMRDALRSLQSPGDEFVYDLVQVPTFEDAVVAVLFNDDLQSCVLRYRFPVEWRAPVPELSHYVDLIDADVRARAEREPSVALAETIHRLRPELDLFKVTDDTAGSVAASATRWFRRVFYRQEDFREMHLSILKGIRERFETPFFTALREYSQKPTGVFHALPISRGKSIWKSRWIQDMGRFYGSNIFLAETSSTAGGLDSLLQPRGPLKKAQEKVARAFGSRHSYFVTNGTSTANKIVMQALVAPGDLVLLSHDCHKSHPYALVLAGAHPVYLDPYPLHDFTMFGGVTLREIKRRLLELRSAGKLSRVRMLLLTNSTFDGIVYDPYRVMREVLAIKPDMIFLWDEAWFAFARATPTYRRRTAMDAAARLRADLATDEHRERFETYAKETADLDPDDVEAWLGRTLVPDPAQARVRVYATQSTHKTLTSLRQGSMIHVHDQDFGRSAALAFHEAYMTHTSTSPNYQILASLDVGRRQLELEGYEMVRQTVGLAMMLRRQITDHPLLRRYFRVLKAKDMIPAEHRESGLERFYDRETGFTRMEEHWRRDEFALDPTRITVHVGATGMDGDTFRRMLIERFDIQINKTSRNTVLFMLNIGSTRGSATYLLDVLLQIANELEEQADDESDVDVEMKTGRIRSLVERLPPLPHFSRFHPAFVDDPTGGTPEGDLRSAFFLTYDAANCEHVPLGELAGGGGDVAERVSAAFITPYPPGFPVLVPGQVISKEIAAYLAAVDVKEIHGYEPAHGLRVFRAETLERRAASRRGVAVPAAGGER